MTNIERLQMNVNQAESDLTNIKTSIQDAGVTVAPGTPTSEYAGKIVEVYEAGQNEMLAYHPEATVSGELISLNDVSELPHDVKCKISGVDNPESVSVTRVGKNLATAQQVWAGADSYSEVVEDGRNTIRFLGSKTLHNKLPVFKENTQYTFSFDTKVVLKSPSFADVAETIFQVLYTDGTFAVISFSPSERERDIWEKRTLTTAAGKTIQAVGTRAVAYYNWLYVDVDTFQVEEGATVTDYEPYNGQTLTPNADGMAEGMRSVSLCMNIFTDTEGANIEATYRKNEAYEAGKQDYWSAVWDGIQKGGTRTTYSAYFIGEHWNKYTFKPKHDMRLTGSNATMFDRFGGQADTTNRDIDLSQIFEDCGVVLDTSQSTNLTNMFYFSSVSRVPTISVVGCTSVLTGIFALCSKLETIDKFILKADGTNTFNNTFQNAYELKNIIVEGVIGANGVNLQASTKLSKESITSFIDALSDTTSGLSITFSKTAKEAAFTEEEWTVLIATKPNWTISLV